jgi:glycosyltransferase involved in cell wall biosynthesis
MSSKERIPQSPPVVKPVEGMLERPLWSVMIPVYNCSNYLKSTLESVLSENISEDQMQIEVVDDCSTDANIEELVFNIGKGRIQYFRQTENIGSLLNFATCLNRSRGQRIHLLHGDDKIKPGFYCKIDALFKNYPQAGAAFTRFAYINGRDKFMHYHDAQMKHDSLLENWLPTLCERQRIQYVSIVVKREVYERLGSFYGVEYGEDWEMWVRIAANYPIAYSPEVLAEYRMHQQSISGKAFLTGQNMKDLNYVMDKISTYLPEKERSIVMKKSKTFYAHYALRIANSIWHDIKDSKGVTIQVNAALKMSKDPMLFYKIIKLYTKIALGL